MTDDIRQENVSSKGGQSGSQGKGFNDDSQGNTQAGKSGEDTRNDEGADYSIMGQKGGKSKGQENNPGNFANDPQKAREAGQKGGQS